MQQVKAGTHMHAKHLIPTSLLPKVRDCVSWALAAKNQQICLGQGFALKTDRKHTSKAAPSPPDKTERGPHLENWAVFRDAIKIQELRQPKLGLGCSSWINTICAVHAGSKRASPSLTLLPKMFQVVTPAWRIFRRRQMQVGEMPLKPCPPLPNQAISSGRQWGQRLPWQGINWQQGEDPCYWGQGRGSDEARTLPGSSYSSLEV